MTFKAAVEKIGVFVWLGNTIQNYSKSKFSASYYCSDSNDHDLQKYLTKVTHTSYSHKWHTEVTHITQTAVDPLMQCMWCDVQSR